MSKRSQKRKHEAALVAVGHTGEGLSAGRNGDIRSAAFLHASAIWTGLFLMVLVGLTVFLYQPALHRVFAGDQLSYLMELNGSESLWDGLRHYDYAVTRRYNKGDESLYRPLLFVWLALNHWLFGSNYFWWNVVNLGLHLVVVMLLFALLRTLQPSPMAAAFALLFAVMPAQIDLVTWNHLGGYLAGFAFLLLALIALQRITADSQPSGNRWLIVFMLSMTVAALFYELLVVMSALVALYLFYLEFRRPEGIRWRLVLPSLIPGAIFSGLYIVHALHCPRPYCVSQPRHGPYVAILITEQALDQIWSWLKQTACPWDYALVTFPYGRSSLGLATGPDAPKTVIYWVIPACLVLLLGAWRTCNRAHLTRRIPLSLTLMAMIAAYSIIIAIGRPTSSTNHPYYLYFFAMIVAILAYILPDWSPGRIQRIPVLCAFALLVIASASLTYDATMKVAKANWGPDHFLTSLRSFVAEHRDEPDLSFVVRDYQNVDITLGVVVGYPATATDQVTRPISGLLFPRYYDPKNPRYILHRKGGALTVVNKRY